MLLSLVLSLLLASCRAAPLESVFYDDHADHENDHLFADVADSEDDADYKDSDMKTEDPSAVDENEFAPKLTELWPLVEEDTSDITDLSDPTTTDPTTKDPSPAPSDPTTDSSPAPLNPTNTSDSTPTPDSTTTSDPTTPTTGPSLLYPTATSDSTTTKPTIIPADPTSTETTSDPTGSPASTTWVPTTSDATAASDPGASDSITTVDLIRTLFGRTDLGPDTRIASVRWSTHPQTPLVRLPPTAPLPPVVPLSPTAPFPRMAFATPVLQAVPRIAYRLTPYIIWQPVIQMKEVVHVPYYKDVTTIPPPSSSVVDYFGSQMSLRSPKYVTLDQPSMSYPESVYIDQRMPFESYPQPSTSNSWQLIDQQVAYIDKSIAFASHPHQPSVTYVDMSADVDNDTDQGFILHQAAQFR